MNLFYYFQMPSESDVEKNNLFFVIACELIGVLLCTAYILYNIKLFSMYLPHVSGISMGLSSDTPFKEPLSFQLIVRLADNFFGIIPFVILFVMMLISFVVYSSQQEEKNFNHQIYKAFGVNYCGLFIILSIAVGIFFPIVDVRNLLPILPSLILILSLLLYPLLWNIGRAIFFMILFPIFCYLSIVYDLNFLKSPSRANENYYLLNQFIPNYPVIYTSYPSVIKSYLDISASPYHTVVLNLNNIFDKNTGVKNQKHILLIDSFVPTSKLQAAIKTVLSDNYTCSPKTNITNMVVNNKLHTLFIILTCDKKT